MWKFEIDIRDVTNSITSSRKRTNFCYLIGIEPQSYRFHPNYSTLSLYSKVNEHCVSALCKIARGKGIMLVSRFGTMVYTESSRKIKEIFFPICPFFFFSHRCGTNKNFCESLTRSCCVLSLFLRIIVVILNRPISLLYVFVICYLPFTLFIYFFIRTVCRWFLIQAGCNEHGEAGVGVGWRQPAEAKTRTQSPLRVLWGEKIG